MFEYYCLRCKQLFVSRFKIYIEACKLCKNCRKELEKEIENARSN